MIIQRSLVSGLMLLLLGSGLTSCGNSIGKRASSDGTAVQIAQTDVRDQFKIGFCWAYAVTGFIESNYKIASGKSVDLSEEALGFYRMSEELLSLAKRYQAGRLTAEELETQVGDVGLEGWFLKLDESSATLDTFRLTEKYGVVPEEIWNIKFETKEKTTAMKEAVKKAFLELMLEKGRDQAVSESDIHAVLTVEKAFPSVPPSTFKIGRKEFTPLTYLQEELGFRADSYTKLTAKTAQEVEALVAATKRALVRGISVPLSYPVNFGLLQNAGFESEVKSDDFYEQLTQEKNTNHFKKNGFHAVLVTDFVNEGGKEGALPIAELEDEFLKESQSLSYFLFKNSWGKKANTNESGVQISGSDNGYYRINRGYLLGSASEAQIYVVVPKDIAADPFGKEPINPAVALKK